MTNPLDMASSVTASGALSTQSGKLRRGIGFGLSALVVLFLLMDGIMKLMAMDIVMHTMGELGWPNNALLARGLGMLLLVCVGLYCLPRTSVLGAVLLTAYMGGAVATHVRVGNPLFSHDLFGVYLGLFIWGGLYLREPRLRALFPRFTAA